MHSDRMRKYGTSESMIQASPVLRHSWQQSHNKGLYYGFRDAILPNLVTMHQATGVSCGILYILVLSLVLLMQSLYTLSN